MEHFESGNNNSCHEFLLAEPKCPLVPKPLRPGPLVEAVTHTWHMPRSKSKGSCQR